MLYIFKKHTGTFVGIISPSGKTLRVSLEQNDENKEGIEMLAKLVPKVKPFRIAGVFENNKKIIADAIERIPRAHPDFWTYLVKYLSTLFPQHYFVAKTDPLSSEVIEKELAQYLGSDMLTKDERKRILASLPLMSDDQIILTHCLLKKMYNNYL